MGNRNLLFNSPLSKADVGVLVVVVVIEVELALFAIEETVEPLKINLKIANELFKESHFRLVF